MIIYKITNKLNGKIYIGQTVQSILDRWHDHSRPRLGRHKQRSAIASAISCHGKENFILEEIDSASSLEELNTKEATYIKALNTLAPNGYNLHLGGNSRLCHPETKEKISGSLKGRPFTNRWTKGNKTPPTEERRERIAKALTGRAAPHNNTPVVLLETGQIFPSVQECAAHFGMERTLVLYYLKTGKPHKKLGITFKRQ